MAPCAQRSQLLSQRVEKLEHILADFLPKSTSSSVNLAGTTQEPIQPHQSFDEKGGDEVEYPQLFAELQKLERVLVSKESKFVGLTELNRKYLKRSYMLQDVSALMDCALDTETKLTLLVAAKSEIEAIYSKLNRIEKLAQEVVEQPLLEQNHEEQLQHLEAQLTNTSVSVQAFHADVQELLAAYSETMDAVSRFFLSHIESQDLSE